MRHRRNLTRWKSHEEILAIAMLLKESQPFKCQTCMGAGSMSLFGLSNCNLCRGYGYHAVGDKTLTAILGN